MSTWQEKARGRIVRVMLDLGAPLESDEEADDLLEALAPVVEAEVRRGQVEALRDVRDTLSQPRALLWGDGARVLTDQANDGDGPVEGLAQRPRRRHRGR